jgi:hypothetical protein
MKHAIRAGKTPGKPVACCAFGGVQALDEPSPDYH